MFRESSKRLEGNDVFEGYAPDLIKEIADILSKFSNSKFKIIRESMCCVFSPEFNYTFKWVDDHKYGKRDQETGEWNGMVGELLAQVGM